MTLFQCDGMRIAVVAVYMFGRGNWEQLFRSIVVGEFIEIGCIQDDAGPTEDAGQEGNWVFYEVSGGFFGDYIDFGMIWLAIVFFKGFGGGPRMSSSGASTDMLIWDILETDFSLRLLLSNVCSCR